MPDPSSTLALVALASAYAGGRWRMGPRSSPLRPWLFAAGLAVVACALSGPLDQRAHQSLTAHMTQHVLLIALAAPLLALGEPLPALFWALPRRWRLRVVPAWRRVVRSHRGGGWTGWAASALLVQASAMWLWHAPALYEPALRIPALHALEHLTLISTSVAFWWSVAGGHRSHYGLAVIVVFVGAFAGTALGAAMLLSPRPWYSAYLHGDPAAAMHDQQLAGVVMWAFGGLTYVFAAALLFASWLARDERRAPERVAAAPPTVLSPTE